METRNVKVTVGNESHLLTAELSVAGRYLLNGKPTGYSFNDFNGDFEAAVTIMGTKEVSLTKLSPVQVFDMEGRA